MDVGHVLLLLLVGIPLTAFAYFMMRPRLVAEGDAVPDERPAPPAPRPHVQERALPAASQQPAPPPLSKDAATLAALERLPVAASVRMPEYDTGRLYLMDGGYGTGWLDIRLRADECICIAGSRRAGKSNLLQLLTLSALTLGPKQVRVWVLDGKNGLDYGFAHQLDHARLYADGCDSADGGLMAGYQAALAEMRERNRLIGAAGFRNINEYNAHAEGDKLPLLLLVCDEVGDLNSEGKQALEELARLSGAAGIILAVATQRPTADVLSSQVQANTPVRICLKVATAKYTSVALALGPGEQSRYEPSLFPSAGIALLRFNGQEQIGRVPELTLDRRQRWISVLRELYPREEPVVLELPVRPAEVAPAVPVWTTEHVKVAAMLASEPGLSNREIARRLKPGTDGGGDAAVKAGKLKAAVLPFVQEGCSGVRTGDEHRENASAEQTNTEQGV